MRAGRQAWTLIGALVVMSVSTLTGCGTGPSSEPAYAPEESRPVLAPTGDGPVEPSPVPEDSVTAGPDLPGPGGSPCITVADIKTALVQDGAVAQSVELSIDQGPLCSGGYAAAVVSAPGRDPLQVVLRRSGNALTLIAAGTFLCDDARVRQAPVDIKAAVGC